MEQQHHQQQQYKHGISQPHYSWQQDGASDAAIAPAKRQRVSPNPTSPFSPSPQTPYSTTPTFSNVALPNNVFNQGFERQTNGLFDTNPRQNTGIMGPPQRPADRTGLAAPAKSERHVDINDLSDLVVASGIDLREEENYLAASYRGDYAGASFTSNSSQTISPNNSFDLLHANNFGNIGANRGSFSQQKMKTVQEEEDEAHKKAARTLNERVQHHLDDPFLWGVSVRRHMDKIAGDNGVQIPIDGLYDRIPDRGQPQNSTSTQADPTNSATVTAPSILDRNTPLEGILSLISLSATERVRILLEDAYSAARSRQVNSDGVVPPEWSDLATGNNEKPTKARQIAITNSPWEAANKTNPTENSNGNSTNPIELMATKSFSPTKSLGQALYKLAQRDRTAEEARLKQRAERKAKKAAETANNAVETANQLTNGTANEDLPPGMLGERAPDVKATKKERERAAKQGASEEQRTRDANTTVSMQLGGRQYAWMIDGNAKSNKPSPAPARPLGGAGGSTSGRAGTPQGLAAIKDRKFGDWREDSDEGQGVQMRDWINVLEMDGKEKRTLSHAYLRLGQDNLPQKPPTTSTSTSTTATVVS